MDERHEIPIERIREVLHYEPETGKLYWIAKSGDKCVVGREAGSRKPKRSIRISVDCVVYQAHRLAWALMKGTQPPDTLDHEDMNKHNNRWGNLREATTSENGGNRPKQKNNRSGIKGVYHYPERATPWLARLQKDGVIWLSKYFATRDEAAAAYQKAANERFGHFARTG